MAEAALRAAGGLTYRDMRVGCLLAAVLVYAFWGSPTPEIAGPAEIIIGFLLIIAVGADGGLRAFDILRGAGWERAGKMLLAYGLSVPLLTALMEGNSLNGVARDIIPFLFLLLPVFLWPLLQERAGALRLLTCAVVTLGLVFSLRVLLPYFLKGEHLSDPFYLANAPTVLFAALLLTGLSGLALYRTLPPPYALKSAVLFGLALIPLAAMAMIMQRASIGVFCVTILVLGITGLLRRPGRVLVPLMLVIAAALVYWPLIAEVGAGLLHKTEQVGLNMRVQEALSVFEEVNQTATSVVFGKGWGASVFSPAAGGVVVNFTHSLITTYWLKTGLIGVGLALFYLYRLGLQLIALLRENPVMALALGGPFVIDILLYASFKSLDFGLVLLLIPLWAGQTQRLQKPPASAKEIISPAE